MKPTCHARAAGVSLLALLLAACGGGGSGPGAGSGTSHALADAIPASSGTCAAGAMTIRIGLDANGNGQLEDGEVSYTQVVCTGSPDGDWRVTLVVEPAGAQCAAGGQRALFGRDANGDGVVQPEEAGSVAYVCNGRDGADGSPGTDGRTSLMQVSVEPPGGYCAAGGSRIESGLDANRNGTLDPGEVAQTAYVCNGTTGANGTNGSNGTNGTNGTDGFDTLLVTSPEPAGTACAYGGTRVENGRDANRNGVLDAAEVAQTAFICNPPPAGLPWMAISMDTAGAANTGYLVSGPNEVTVTLPEDPAVGSLLRVQGLGVGGWRLEQRAGQSVHTGALPLSARWSGPWMERSIGMNNLSAVASSADGRMLLVADQSEGVYTSNDYGATWVHRHSVLIAVDASSSADGKVLAVGTLNHGVRISRDAGATWSTMQTLGRFGVGVSALGDHITVADRDGAQLQRSADAGQTWTVVAFTANWRAVALSADGQIQLAAPTGDQLHVSFDHGQTWTARPSGAQNWTHVAVSADGSRMAATALSGRIYVSADYGATWIPRAQTGNWNALGMSTDGRTIVAGQVGGNLWVSEDYGGSWTIRETGTWSWAGIACSSDCGRIVGAISTSHPLMLSPRNTVPGAGHGVAGSAEGMVELQYLGGGAWTVTGYSGKVAAW